MSHFAVLVIGPDHEKQLAPYHEFECTGVDDEYVVDEDITDEVRKDYTTHGDGESFLEFAQSWHGYPVVLHGVEASGSRIELDEEGDVARVVRYTNPNAQWDWYVVGGRWCGFFPLKIGETGTAGQGAGAAHDLRADPGTADILLLGQVDFERARSEAATAAGATFDTWASIFLEHGKPEPWSSFLAKHKKSDNDAYPMDRAREDFHSQPAIAHASKSRALTWGCPVDAYGFDREAHMQKARDNARGPFAVVKDGKWHEKGDMGWWGIVSNEKDPADWQKQVQALYDDLPPDTLLTLVDCHI